jgi:hypothetical protein
VAESSTVLVKAVKPQPPSPQVPPPHADILSVQAELIGHRQSIAINHGTVTG